MCTYDIILCIYTLSPPVSPLMIVMIIRCDSGSGTECNDSGLEILTLSSPSFTIPAGSLILNPLGLCSSGECVNGWRYCYYKNSIEPRDINITFSLWRQSEYDIFEEVEGTHYELSMEILPGDEWFICENIELISGCGGEVEAGDLVGVVNNGDDSVSMIGEMKDGVVLIGEDEDGDSVISSPYEEYGHVLLVSAILGQSLYLTIILS